MIDNIIDPPSNAAANAPKAVLAEVSELHQFCRIVRALRKGKWIFRGQGNAEWSLQTSLERRGERKGPRSSNATVDNALKAAWARRYRMSDEMYAIEIFRRHAQNKLPYLSHYVEWLSAMQHYGAATRLLDFTRSIYVALYFAIEDIMAEKDAAIYVVKFSELIHNATIRDELISSQLVSAKRAGKQRNPEANRMREEFVRNNYFTSNCVLQNTLIDLADKHIEDPGKKRGVIPVSVPGVNERLIAQAGLFLMPRNFDPFEEHLSKSLGVSEKELREPSCEIDFDDWYLGKKLMRECAYMKIVLQRKLTSDLRQMLDQANVSSMSLFPGLEGIAKSSRYTEPLFG